MGSRGSARHAHRRARRLDHHLHGLWPRRPRRVAGKDLGLPQLRAPGVGHDSRGQERGRCCRGRSTANGCSFTARPPGRRPTSGSRVRTTSRAGALRSWSCPVRPGGWWDSARIGMGAPPLETDAGWLVVYHGVRETVAGGLYRAGLALLDLEAPATRAAPLGGVGAWPAGRVRGHGRRAERRLSLAGSCATSETDTLSLYYGAADTRIGLATADCSEVLDYLLECPAG